MLSAHFAPTLIAKALRPSMSLPIGMACCMLPDLFHMLFVMIGIERFTTEERYSHSLLMVSFLSIVVFLSFYLGGASPIDGAIYSVCVLSHFAFDLINRHRMLVTPWGKSLQGLGLHERGIAGGHRIGFTVEIILVIGPISAYAASIYDGRVKSLFIPAVLLLVMLIAEIFYFRVYSPSIKIGREKRRAKIT